MRNECNITRDILPLYVENMVSGDTASFVAEHLENCASCREELAKLKKSTELADMGRTISGKYVNEASPLKTLKRKMRRKRILTILLSFAAAAALIGSTAFMLFIWGAPAVSENIKLETEFQYSKTGYLNQAFVLHITQMTDKPLSVSVKDSFQTNDSGNYVYDEYGHKILAGYEITVREIPLGQNPNNYTIGYSYGYDTVPDEDFDFTITVKFRDATVVYSMAEEGLFVPQDKVQY